MPSSVAVQLESLEAAWKRQVETYLPIEIPGSPWRASAPSPSNLPRQGWKLHVSATILNAPIVLSVVGPALAREDVYFKGAASATELKRINCGLFQGYSQVGKFLTVYPGEDPAELSRIARILVAATAGLEGPNIPFERRLAAGSPVFARYGLFRNEEGAAGSGQLLGPAGGFEPDRRDRNPDWVLVPDDMFTPILKVEPGRLATDFKAYAALSQRGKGGVFRALDLTSRPARHCILKEGRSLGEIDLDGHDGRSRLRQEALVLADLAERGVPVPGIYAEFEERGNAYLALEWIDGQCVADFVRPDDAPVSVPFALDLCAQTADLLAAIHRCGWVWRDLKAPNLLLDIRGVLRPIDFEGAIENGADISSIWGSPGHVPPEWGTSWRATFSQDLYALGALMRQLFTRQGTTSSDTPTVADGNLDAPAVVEQLILELTDADPGKRPAASEVAMRLTA